MYLLSGQWRINSDTDKIFSSAVKELKELLVELSTHLEGKEFIAGDHLTLADILIASYIVYPINLTFNIQQRNTFLNTTNWFNKISEMQEFQTTFGIVKSMTKSAMRPPVFPKVKAQKTKDKKPKAKKVKHAGKKAEAKPVEEKKAE